MPFNNVVNALCKQVNYLNVNQYAIVNGPMGQAGGAVPGR